MFVDTFCTNIAKLNSIATYLNAMSAAVIICCITVVFVVYTWPIGCKVKLKFTQLHLFLHDYYIYIFFSYNVGNDLAYKCLNIR